MNAMEQDRLADPADQAAGFGRIREDHRSELAEDYVELIADLIAAHGEARTVDLAERLGVTSATVNSHVSRLQRDGLVRSEPYRSIFLTLAGEELAEQCRERHRVVVECLKKLGVPDEIAARDAEGIEHHVSAETLSAMALFVNE